MVRLSAVVGWKIEVPEGADVTNSRGALPWVNTALTVGLDL